MPYKKRLRHTSRKLPITLSQRDVVMLVVGALLAVIAMRAFNGIWAGPVPLAAKPTSTITISWLPDSVKQWQAPIVEMSRKYNLDPNFVAIIMTIESRGTPTAVSPVGAQGLMQVMPATAEGIARKHLKTPVNDYNLQEPRTNIEFGVAYLAWLRDTYASSKHSPTWEEAVRLVSAGYNGGPGASELLLNGQPLKYQETILYSQKAAQLWQLRGQADAKV